MVDVIKRLGGNLQADAKGLLLGLIFAQVLANLAYHEYHEFIEGTHLHFVVNDIVMNIFFLAVEIELYWDIFVKGGALNPVKKAILPLFGTFGGVVMPITFFCIGWLIFDIPFSGWAIGTATDIAFSVVILSMIFVKNHPGEKFLKVLAIADDLVGIAFIAIFYSEGSISAKLWVLLSVATMIGAIFLKKKTSVRKWYWYVPLFIVSWVGLYLAGVHPALATFLPVIGMPHPTTDPDPNDDFHVERSAHGKSTQSQLLRLTEFPMPAVLFLFGFVNGGVKIFSEESWSSLTLVVFVSLAYGKAVGVPLWTWIGMKLTGLNLNDGLTMRHVCVVGATAGIGLTVALFVAGEAFPSESPELASASVAALLSLPAGTVLVIGLAKRVWKLPFHAITAASSEEEQGKQRTIDEVSIA